MVLNLFPPSKTQFKHWSNSVIFSFLDMVKVDKIFLEYLPWDLPIVSGHGIYLCFSRKTIK